MQQTDNPNKPALDATNQPQLVADWIPLFLLPTNNSNKPAPTPHAANRLFLTPSYSKYKAGKMPAPQMNKNVLSGFICYRMRLNYE